MHPIRSWTDLKKRVGNYRRCFIFTHSCMPNEPLVVLHTFLTNEISSSMNKIVQSQRCSSFGMVTSFVLLCVCAILGMCPKIHGNLMFYDSNNNEWSLYN